MSIGSIAPTPWFTGLDDDGAIVPGGLLYMYLAGTTTPLDTYFDAEMIPQNLNSNPIVLDSAGRCVIFLQASTYKFVLKDADGALIKSVDNVAATVVSNEARTLGEIYYFGGDIAVPVVAAAYPSGATYDKLHAGTSFYVVDSADLPRTYALQAMILSVGGGVVTVAIMDLDDGSPDVALASVGSASLTGVLATSGDITFAAAGANKTYGIKVKVASGSGFVWGIRLVSTS